MPKKKKQKKSLCPIICTLAGIIILLLVALILISKKQHSKPLPNDISQVNQIVEESLLGSIKDYKERGTSVGNPYFAPQLTKQTNPEFDKLLMILSGADSAQSFSVMQSRFAPTGEYAFVGFLVNKNQFPLLTVEGVIGPHAVGPVLYGLNTQTPGSTLTEVKPSMRKSLLKTIEDFLNMYAKNSEKAIKTYADEKLFVPEVLQPLAPFIKKSQKDLTCEVYYGDTMAYEALKEIIEGLNKNIKGYGINCKSGNINSKYTIIQNGKKQTIVGLHIN